MVEMHVTRKVEIGTYPQNIHRLIHKVINRVLELV